MSCCFCLDMQRLLIYGTGRPSRLHLMNCVLFTTMTSSRKEQFISKVAQKLNKLIAYLTSFGPKRAPRIVIKLRGNCIPAHPLRRHCCPATLSRGDDPLSLTANCKCQTERIGKWLMIDSENRVRPILLYPLIVGVTFGLLLNYPYPWAAAAALCSSLLFVFSLSLWMI